MENGQWKYKIGSRKMPVILTLIMFAAFGGLTAWLYSTDNGAFIFTGLFSAILLALVIATGYRLVFYKVLIGKDGFYYQTNPFNGTYFSYQDITRSWEVERVYRYRRSATRNHYFYLYFTGSPCRARPARSGA